MMRGLNMTEIEKYEDAKNDMDTVYEFLTGCGYTLFRKLPKEIDGIPEDHFYPLTRKEMIDAIHDYYDIDLEQLENEKMDLIR